MSEKNYIGLSVYATIGMTVPNFAPIRKYEVLASGRCKVCEKEIILIEAGCFHLDGDTVDVGGAAGHAPRMFYRDLFRDVIMETMKPFLGVTPITGPNMEMMRLKVEGACYSHLRSSVGVHPRDPNPFPMVNARYSPPDVVNIVFTPEDFIPFGEEAYANQLRSREAGGATNEVGTDQSTQQQGSGQAQGNS